MDRRQTQIWNTSSSSYSELHQSCCQCYSQRVRSKYYYLNKFRLHGSEMISVFQTMLLRYLESC